VGSLRPCTEGRTGTATVLTAQGLDIAALQFKKTGIMPPLGMGDRRLVTACQDGVARIFACPLCQPIIGCFSCRSRTCDAS
jgi:hypothetical protein